LYYINLKCLNLTMPPGRQHPGRRHDHSEFEAELGRIRATKAYTEVGLKVRASEMGAAALDRARRFSANISKGREAIADFDQQLAAASAISSSDSAVTELRQREVRDYLAKLDPIERNVVVDEAVRLRDGEGTVKLKYFMFI
jgi:hypothetical protein